MLKKLFFPILVVIIYLILYRIYIPRVSAFGCFDDCFNFAAGYFIDHGKVLYSQIFYNHQLLPAYVSALIQAFAHPINIFDLVLKHRQFLIFYGLFFNLFLVSRFGLPAFFFFLFFEFTKFYIFGDRFLAEGILVYPLTYLTFGAWNKLNKQSLRSNELKIKFQNYDYIILSFLSWFVVFLREIFAPVALVLFFYVLFPCKRNQKFRNIAILIFIVLTLVSLFSVNLKDYYFELVTVNSSFFSQGLNVSQIIFYPIHIFTSDKWNLFRVILIGIDILFIISLGYLVVLKRELKYLLIFIPLVLSNLRAVPPGQIFYESFHMIPFYGMFLAFTFLMVWQIKKYNRKIWLVLVLGALFIFSDFVISKNVFFKEKANPHEEFFTNYSNILQVGEIVKKISKPKDTLFVDGYDEVIYWVANRPSSYKYSMYTSFMPDFSIYSNARLEMFRKSPPDFYYGSCPKEKNLTRLIPEQFINDYVRLYSFSKPSCVFVNKIKLRNITTDQWKKANDFGYSLPK